MNLPRRVTDSMRRPANRWDSLARLPGVTKREVKLRADDPAAGQVRGHRANYGFDFRKFRHLGNVLGTSMRMSSPSIFTGNFATSRHSVAPCHWLRVRQSNSQACHGQTSVVPCKSALSQRASGVRADPVQSVNLAARVANGIGSVADQGLHHRSGRQRGEQTDFHKGHNLLSAVILPLRRAGACVWAFSGAWEAESRAMASPDPPARGRSPGRPSSD